jgi:hypothetical protein
MRLRHHLILLATFCLLLPMRAEEKPDQFPDALGPTNSSDLNTATAAHGPPTVTVRALKRLVFEIPRWVTPAGGREPITFVFRRSGDTNESLTVYCALSGTARVDEDYARLEYLPPYNPSTIITGAVQSMVFSPGERFRRADFLITQDEIHEPAEMVRLRLLPPSDSTNFYQSGGRRCATVWVLHRFSCVRMVSTPAGGQTCVGYRPVILPRAFFATEVCR